MTQIPVDLDTRRRITFNIDYLPANSKLELKDNNNNIIGLPCNVTSEQTNYTYIVSEKVPTGTYTLEISLKNNLTDTYTIFNTTQIRVLKTSNDEVIRDIQIKDKFCDIIIELTNNNTETEVENTEVTIQLNGKKGMVCSSKLIWGKDKIVQCPFKQVLLDEYEVNVISNSITGNSTIVIDSTTKKDTIFKVNLN